VNTSRRWRQTDRWTSLSLKTAFALWGTGDSVKVSTVEWFCYQYIYIYIFYSSISTDFHRFTDLYPCQPPLDKFTCYRQEFIS